MTRSVTDLGADVEPSLLQSLDDLEVNTSFTSKSLLQKLDDLEETYIERLGFVHDKEAGRLKTTVSQRLVESSVEFTVGCLLILLSIPLLWYNERRAAQVNCLCKRAESDIVPAEKSEPGNLVHLMGDSCVDEKLKDEKFGLSVFSSVRLRRDVEQFLWHEIETWTSGSGFTYTYEGRWTNRYVDSSTFAEVNTVIGPEHENPYGVEALGIKVTDAKRPRVLDYDLDSTLIARLNSWKPVDLDKEELKALGRTFQKHGNIYYSGANPETPAIGDVRVFFHKVEAGPTTVVALRGEAGFLPYRPMAWPKCPMFSFDERAHLLEMGTQSIGFEGFWSGPLHMRNQIFFIKDELMPKEGVFQYLRSRENFTVTLLRILGLLTLFLGSIYVLLPLKDVLALIPILDNPYVPTVGVCALMTTALVSAVIIGLAYMFYNPFVFLVLLCYVIGTGIAIRLVYWKARHQF